MRNLSQKFLVALVFAALFFIIANKSFALTKDSREDIQKIFSLGRGLGSSYYHLTNLYDQTQFKSYSALKNEYGNTFQGLNLIEIILDDMEINKDSYTVLNNLRTGFYNSLKDQDLNEINLFCLREAYVDFYKILIMEVNNKYGSEGSWLLTLGFYTSFQAESLNSPTEQKLLLSGFYKILSTNPLNLPKSVLKNLQTIESLDKIVLSDKEINFLNKEIAGIISFFDNYPNCNSSPYGTKELVGKWQGSLIDPENQKHKIKLTVAENMKITMNIDDIAQNIDISDVKLINKYLTFMFKPFGGEKLYIKFNAKVSNNTFTGEAADVLGQKGNCLLSKIE